MGNRRLRQDERLLAAANHVGSIFFPFIGPLCFWGYGLVASRYVAYHARIAFMEAIYFKLATVAVGLISLVLTINKVGEIIQTNGAAFSWDLVWQAVLKFAVLWIIFALANAVTAIRSLFQARDAYRGKVGKRVGERLLANHGIAIEEV